MRTNPLYPTKPEPKPFGTRERATLKKLKVDRSKLMIPSEGEVLVLNQKQELFLQYYMLNAETRYNGTWSYNKAYNKGLEKILPSMEVKVKDENGKYVLKEIPNPEHKRMRTLCAQHASDLLSKPVINARRIQLANENLNNIVVDSELSQIITQNTDLSAKNKAISEYNKLNQRIIDRVDVRSTSIGIVKHVFDKADRGTTSHVIEETNTEQDNI